MASYPGRAFYTELPDGQGSGLITIETGILRFQAAELTVTLPLESLKLELGGAAARLLFFSHPNQPDWSIFTSELSILEDEQLLANPHTANQLTRIRRKRTIGRLIPVLVLLMLIPAGFGLFQLKDPLIRAVADRIPASLEIKLGNMAMGQIRAAGNFIEDPTLDEGLVQLTSALIGAVPNEGYEYEFHIVEDESINAFALPGGNVVLHTGLILTAETPEEVVGVLGHELAHVTEKHAIRQILGTAGLYLLVDAFLGDVSGIAAVLIDGGTQLLTLRYSRDFEREADDVGWSYLVTAGVDPEGLIRFFGRLKEQEGDLGEGVSQALAILGTHPATDERITHLQEKLAQETSRPNPRSIELNFAAFQDRVRESTADATNHTSAGGSE